MDNPDFIDRLLEEKEDASGYDILQAIAEEIYSDVSKWEKLEQYPQYVQDVFYIIDYDTILQMEGLEGFFEARRNYAETYQALMNCGARSEAEILKKASAISFDQEDYNEQYLILEKQTAYENDYEGFWKLVTDDIVLLSADDTKEDSLGNNVTFHEGMPVSLYSDGESDLKACREEELAVTKRLESYCLTVRRVCGLMTYLLSSKDYKTILADSALLTGLSMKKAAIECQIKIAERIGNPDIFVAVVYHAEWNRRFRWTPELCLRCGDALFHVFYHAGWICRECGCNNGEVLMPMAEADPVFYKRGEQECWKFSDKFRKILCKNCGKILQNHLIKVETYHVRR